MLRDNLVGGGTGGVKAGDDLRCEKPSVQAVAANQCLDGAFFFADLNEHALLLLRAPPEGNVRRLNEELAVSGICRIL